MRDIPIEKSTGNVFADLELANPEERLAKAGLAIRIAQTIRQRRLTQTGAARILHVDHPTLSRLLRGQLSGFSAETLTRLLTRLAAT